MHPLASTTARPVIVTGDPDLLDQLLRLCAAAGVTPEVVSDPAEGRESWSRAGAVIVGTDRADAMSRLGLTRRDNVVLVAQHPGSETRWQQAVELRADDVVTLPAEEARLIDLLADLADGGGRAVTVGVIGGSGGAGASTTAAALALTSVRTGRASLLVDADCLGGGIELVLGCEDSPGLRWPDVVATQGRVSAAAFRDALPRAGELPVLSWDRCEVSASDPVAMQSMLAAGQRGADLVIVDLPRRLDAAAREAVLLSDAVVVVVAADVRGVAAARSVVARVREICSDVRLVVRELPGSDLSPSAVAASLDLQLIGSVSTHRAVARSINDGLGPLARGRLARSCSVVLQRLLPRPASDA